MDRDGDADGGHDTGEDDASAGGDSEGDERASGTAESEILGWPPDGPKLRLDHRRFSYAGKFVMSNTGKAVIRDVDVSSDGVDDLGDDGEGEEVDNLGDDGKGEEADAFDDDRDSERVDDVLAAVAFNADRTDPKTLWLRYVTVRKDRRGEGLGPRLSTFVVDRAAERGYERARIAVNNPFAYEALYRAGFAYTAEETGLAELVLERSTDSGDVAGSEDRTTDTYQAGLDRYRERGGQLSDAERDFLERKRGRAPPESTLVD